MYSTIIVCMRVCICVFVCVCVCLCLCVCLCVTAFIYYCILHVCAHSTHCIFICFAILKLIYLHAYAHVGGTAAVGEVEFGLAGVCVCGRAAQERR